MGDSNFVGNKNKDREKRSRLSKKLEFSPPVSAQKIAEKVKHEDLKKFAPSDRTGLTVHGKGIFRNGKDYQISEKTPLIELKQVFKGFQVAQGDVRVLKNINLTIYSGEFVLILGPSGSGKSTVLNTIMGLERPTSGEVLVGGNDLVKASADELARFRVMNYGIIFQKPDWIKALDVLGNVAFPMAIINVPKRQHDKAAEDLLDIVGVNNRARYKPYELSAGEQEKVEVARALINNPPILIADEPTGNLDSDSATKIMDLFQMLNEELKRTVIMVTHNVSHVKYATRTIYLKDGQLLDGQIHDEDIKKYEETPVI